MSDKKISNETLIEKYIATKFYTVLEIYCLFLRIKKYVF